MGLLKTVFMGTPEIAVPFLKKLNELTDVKLVITQPDKPKGRKRVLTPPPVKVEAEKLNVEVIQPEKIKKNEELLSKLKKINPDLILVVAYGKIIPENILNLPKYGCLNIHFSALPKYRGAAPVNWAIVNGEVITDVCLMKMDKGLDTGPIIGCLSEKIDPNDNAEDLFQRLTEKGLKLLETTLFDYVEGKITPIPQIEEHASYAPIIKKSDGKLDPNLPAIDIHNRVRGFYPWPSVFGKINGKTMKILKTFPSEMTSEKEPGTIVIKNGIPFMVCGDKHLLKLMVVQPESKKPMDGKSAVNGGYLKDGDKFE
ncbi:methionyl-tRNA formyltransferase [Thermotomaculum hydrothermale]|uniref:Methionyl-tRNA formyltransferase n=1 Tax=Thermotomaculum hydrothermale TaxID=981385 RepID=A0A7R6PN71_9BACT|nr:methionyl-tRNA formyltransferase [Thermotomaculum hydrothermale]BBB32678.1 methionyl-tRNA formyltransferase [Thermotomaculum hydrothermale]